MWLAKLAPSKQIQVDNPWFWGRRDNMKTRGLVVIRFPLQEDRIRGTYELIRTPTGEVASLGDSTFLVSANLLPLLDKNGILYEEVNAQPITEETRERLRTTYAKKGIPTPTL
jgi:hypothetical protein